MVSKRRPLHQNSSSKLNFRPNVAETQKQEGRGSKPLPEPSTVSDILLMMILHGCRKVVFFDTKIKVAIYLSSLFIVSLLADVLPFPKTYFSRKDNILNVYFVKIAWGWTLLLTLPFVVLTSYTTCCGKREKVVKHLSRLGIATATWFIWVNLFNYIERSYGKCNVKNDIYQSKSACLAKGYFWQGFDLSGHAFLLVYSSLVIIEEARAVIGWEGIRDMIRNEDHARAINDSSTIGTSLKGLSLKDFESLKQSYEKFTPYVRILFISMSVITVLWDFMLINTMLYFHHMVEKFLSGLIAVSMWFITYQIWYSTPNILPELPGEGMFKYKDTKQSKEVPLKKKPSLLLKGELPKFMGMPLTGLRNQDNVEERNGSFSSDTDVSTL
ncbi:acyl-coenzyme A diphosphatase Fitm [Lycorma delicatula]|uniref:acyl-coenzyme A diphosphatase Fitm n=1 Tax=Lycorma delicatula TaxID=130591 RepID=UPI003F5127FC